MTVSTIEHNNNVAVKFVSTNRSVSRFISRQKSIIFLYVILSIIRLSYADTWPALKYVNPIYLLLFIRVPIIDSVQSIANQGIQISCSGGLLLLPRDWNNALFTSIKFIPQDEIEDIFINEAFRGLQVIYYLAVLVKDQKKLQVLFERTLPRLQDLVPVYSKIHGNLFVDSDFKRKHQHNNSINRFSKR